MRLHRAIGGWAPALLLLTMGVRPVSAAAPSDGDPPRTVDPQSNAGASKTALDALPAATAALVSPLSQATAVPLYRLYYSGTTDHLYTTNASERDYAKSLGFLDQGIAAYVEPAQVAGTLPFQRFYMGPPRSDHFYTTDAGEAKLVRNFGFIPEGIEGYLYTTQVGGSVPLHRLLWCGGGTSDCDHFYTIDPAERDRVLTLGWGYDGVAGYVWTAATPPPGAPNAAAFVSQSVPANMILGQSYPVSVTMRNSGTNTWRATAAYNLGSQNPPDNLFWGTGRVGVPFDVPPGGTVTLTFKATPSRFGSLGFQWRMVQDGVEWFGDFTPNVPVTVSPPSGTPNGAAFVSQSVPANMILGQSYPVSVTMRNSGTNTWSAASAYRLGSQNPQDNFTWGRGRVDLPFDVPPGGTVTFTFNVTPSGLGSLNFQWRMVQDGVAWFGDVTPNVPVTVSPIPPPPPAPQINVALAGNGGIASASSTYKLPGYPVVAINDNERAGVNWGNGGGWADGTPDTYPDWVEIDFSGSKTIDHVVVYTVQDNWPNPVEPTDTLTFTRWGITDFAVEGWFSNAWVTLGTVSGNNLVKRTVSFPAATTDRIRINITNALASSSRITEVEAWAVEVNAPPPPTALKSFAPASIGTGASSVLSVTLNPKLLYVSNFNDNTVSVVNSATDTVLGTMPVGTNPYFAAVNPGGSRVYVTNFNSNNVSVLDTASNAVIATIAVGSQPTGIAVSPTGNVAYVTNFSGATVSVLNTTTNSVIATVAAGTNPINVTMNPAGTLAYVSNYGSNTVSVFDTASNGVIATIPVGANPRGLAVNPAGSLLYVSNSGSNAVSIVNTSNNTVAATAGAGAYPLDVALNPAGSRAYVSNYRGNSVSVLDTASNAVVATVAVGTNPVGVALNPAATKAFVANSGASSLSVIDTASNTVTATIAVGGSPLLLASSIVAPFAGPTTGVTVTDAYPVGLVNISNAVPTTTCGGTATVASNGSAVALFGGTIPANDSCTLTVNVTSAAAGTYVNSTAPISTANAGTGAAATATLTVVTVNQLPTVVLNAPANSATFAAPAAITITATATDPDGTVTKVEFYQGATLLGTVTTGGPGNTGSSYSFTWSNVAAGSYSLTAKAFDNLGASTTSAGVSISVNANGPPTAALTSPANGTAFAAPATITITATATDPDGAVSKVEFYRYGTILLGTVTTGGAGNTGSSYSFTWTNVPAGNYSLTAKAYDNLDASTTSSAVTVTVGGVAMPPPPTALKSFTPASIATGASSVLSIMLNPKLLYVSNFNDNTVSVVNSAANTVLGTIPVGKNPFYATVNAGGARVYVTNLGSSNVSVIDAASYSVIATIGVGSQPTGIAVSNANNVAYVTNYESSTVSVLNTATNSVIATLTAGLSPVSVAMNPAGTRAYVSNFGSGNVSVFDTASNGLVATIPVGAGPRGIGCDPAGSLLYVANSSSNTVSVINAASNTVIATIAVGAYPFDVTVNPTGGRAYVSNFSGSSVSVLDTARNAVIATVGVGPQPAGVALNPAATKAYVANSAANTLSVIDTASNTVSATIATGYGPRLLASSIVAPFAGAATGVAFTDIYPAGLVNTADASPSTTCGGTVTAANNGNSVALSSGTIPGNDSCTVTVSVSSATAGSYVNSTGAISTANAGTGAAASGTLTVIQRAPTTTTLTGAPNPSTIGTSVTFTATVTGSAPTGTVNFTDGGTAIGGCGALALAAGTANAKTSTCSTSSLSVGTHSIVATYGGDANNTGSVSSPLSQAVISDTDRAPVITSVSPNAALAFVGETISFNVVASDPDAGDPINVYLLGTTGPAPTAIHGSGLDSYIVSWTPQAVGDYNLSVQVTDSHGLSATQAVSAHVMGLPSGTVGDADLICSAPGTSGVGTTAGSFSVSDSGAATYSIPVQVPPGTAGLQPGLALSYSSQGGDGLLGVGWSLAGLSAITRCPATEAQDGTRRGFNYDIARDNDAYCLDGQRLIPIAESFVSGPDPNYPYSIPTIHKIEYRTEVDGYAKIESYDDPSSVLIVGPYRFRATTKSGQILDFASRWWIVSRGAYQYAFQLRLNTIKLWALDSVSDRAGNSMLVDYDGTNGNVLKVAEQTPQLARNPQLTESASSASVSAAVPSGQPEAEAEAAIGSSVLERLQGATAASSSSVMASRKTAAASPRAVASNGVSLYRWYSGVSTDHFYTTINYSSISGFISEGIAANVEATQVPGTLPFYRFYHNWPRTDHFYTTDLSERQIVLDLGYEAEGIEGYIYASPVAGTLPLYRCSWCSCDTSGCTDCDHVYTTDPAERDQAVNLFHWGYDGIAGYVWPAGPTGPRNAAVFVSQSIPGSMTLGQSYPVSVTMRNTGTATWTAAGVYRLGSQNPPDNLVWGIGRVVVPSDVPPGDTVTFTFNVTPSGLGFLNFQWRMVQEGVEWFGDLTPNVPVAVVRGQSPQPIGSFPDTEFWPTAVRYYSAHDVNTQHPGYNEIAFFVKPRSEVAPQDVQRFFDEGAGMSTLTMRLDAIRVTVDKSDTAAGTRVRTYYLNYGVSPTSKRLQLQNVQEQADDLTVLPPTSFDWTSTGLSFQGPGSTSALTTINADAATKVKVADLDGDGRSDLIRYAGGQNWEICKGPLDPGNCVIYTADSYGDNGDVSRWQVGDITGDGRARLITYDDTSHLWSICRFNGSGFDYPCDRWSGPILYHTNDEWNEFYWADFDGDGRMDIISYRTFTDGNNLWDVCLSTGSGFNCQRDVPIGQVLSSGNLRARVMIADINGDGKADYLERKSQLVGEDHWKICLADFGPGVAAPGFHCAADFVQGLKGDFNHFVIMDLNGDGLADMITRVESPSAPAGEPCAARGDCWQVCLSAGDGAFEFTDPAVHWGDTGLVDGLGNPVDPYSASRCRYWSGLNAPVDNVIYGDFNGDGRTDMAAWDPVNRWFTVCYSTGAGFSCQAAQNNFPIWADGGEQHKADAVVTGDFNGDGKTDILLQNNHSNWAKGMGDPGFADQIMRVTTGLGATTDVSYAPITDSSIYAKGNSPPGSRELVIQSPLYVVKETQASNGVGGQFPTTYFYEGLKGRTDGRGIEGFFRRRMLDGNGILSEVEAEQAFPLSGRPRRATKWAPVSGARPDPAAVLRVSPLDFPQSGVLTRVNESSQLWSSVSRFAGQSYQGAVIAPIAQPTAFSRAVYQVELAQSIQQSFELDSTPLPQTTSSITEFDDFGNPGQVIVSTVDAAEGIYSKQTSNQYLAADRDKWIIGRLTQASVTSRKPTGEILTRTSSWSYGSAIPSRDHPYDGACWLGFVCTETIEPGSVNDGATYALWQQASYAYDRYGNRTSTSIAFHERGPGDTVTRTTQTTYFDGGDGAFNNRGRFALSTTPPIVNGIALTESRQYDNRFGGVTVVNSPNGMSSTASYDGFGRKLCGTAFDGSSGTGHRLDQSETVVQSCGSADFTYPGIDTSCQGGESYRVRSRASGGAVSYVFYDTLQRERRAFTKAFNNLQWASTSTDYDALGRKRTMVKPAGNGTITTTLDYDVLNRVKTETTTGNGGGIRSTVATTTYSGLTTTVTRTNPSGSGSQTMTRTVNSQGLTTRVADAAGQTTFIYDALGNMRQTTGPPTPNAPGGITVTMGYDLRGRKTGMADPDMGNWQYGYSGAGDLVFQRDGKGQETRVLYDLLGRMSERREYPGADIGTGSGVVVNGTLWTYDACNVVATGNGAAGRGKLCGMETHAFFPYSESNLLHRQVNAYDGAARSAMTTTTVGSTVYVSGAQYDSNGRISQLEYPSGLVVKQGYSLWNGQVAAITDAVGNAYWQATSRYSDGQIASMQVGPHTTSKTYDPLGRVASIATPGLQSSSYAFDELGNLVSRADPLVGQPAETYGYDLVNRLVSANGSTVAAYDAAGDITWRSDVGNYSYYPNTHRLQSAGSQVYSYDPNGTLTSGGGRTVISTVFNMPQRITAGNNILDFAYDGNHARTAEAGSVSGFTFFVGSQFYEEQFKPDGTLVRRHYIATPEGVVALVQQRAAGPTVTSTTRYWHKDHLGSVVAISNEQGQPVERVTFDVWGRRSNPSLAPGEPLEERGYTGHETLDDVAVANIGLVHMNGRIYDPATGRFLSADPMVQDPFNAQSYNRYSYVLNNPLSFTDPTGFSWWTKWRRQIFAIAAAWAIGPEGLFGEGGLFGPAVFGGGGVFGSATANAFASTVAGGFAAGGIQGGNIESAVQGALFGGLNFGIGQITSGASIFGDGAFAANVGLHAALGCAQQASAGGSCRAGALSGGFSALAGPFVHGPPAVQLLAHVAIGGLASRLGGGKFESGAITAAFEYLFNECGHTHMCGSDSTKVEVQGNVAARDYLNLGEWTNPTSLHLSISISDGYAGVTTLDAQPRPCPWLLCLASDRVAGPPRGMVWGPIELAAPAGMTTTSFANALSTNAGQFMSYLVPYTILPMAPWEYNSNSWVAGLLGRTMGTVPSLNFGPYQAPGYANPVPGWTFGR